MPDITMCSGEGCKSKETCYRYKATPSSIQSYFLEPPIVNNACEHYINKNYKLNTKYNR